MSGSVLNTTPTKGLAGRAIDHAVRAPPTQVPVVAGGAQRRPEVPQSSPPLGVGALRNRQVLYDAYEIPRGEVHGTRRLPAAEAVAD